MSNSGVLPTFLVIGVKKAGSTWLYNLLKSHKHIFVPKYRKELQFFEKNFFKGVEWYKSFFPISNEKDRYKAVGEATPGYIFSEKAPNRIQKVIPNAKFIIILRNPVDRLFSEYKYYRQRGGKNSFDTFSRTDDRPFEMGLYSDQLKFWFSKFERNQFLILIFEECVHNEELTKRKLAEFLNLETSDFNSQENKPKNSSFRVRLKPLYLFFVKFAAILRKFRLDYIIHMILKTGIVELFKADTSELHIISDDKKSRLWSQYSQSVKELEILLDRDLSIWRKTE